MSNFLDQVEMFLKDCLAKQFHQQFHAWIRQRNEGETARINYFFKLHHNSFLCQIKRKTTSSMKLF